MKIEIKNAKSYNGLFESPLQKNIIEFLVEKSHLSIWENYDWWISVGVTREGEGMYLIEVKPNDDETFHVEIETFVNENDRLKEELCKRELWTESEVRQIIIELEKQQVEVLKCK